MPSPLSRAAALVFALLPVAALAAPSSNIEPPREPTRQTVEQRVLDEPGKALEQLRGSVCGTGPVYVGNADAPVFVTPLFHPTCTIAPTAPEHR